jgi:RNase H-fold protein (predicted Holliday junction resolvase)
MAEGVKEPAAWSIVALFRSGLDNKISDTVYDIAETIRKELVGECKVIGIAIGIPEKSFSNEDAAMEYIEAEFIRLLKEEFGEDVKYHYEWRTQISGEFNQVHFLKFKMDEEEEMYSAAKVYPVYQRREGI